MRQQHLDRNKAIQRCIERLKNYSHPATADDSGHLVRPDSPQHLRIIAWPQQLERGYVADPRIRLTDRRFIVSARQSTISIAKDRQMNSDQSGSMVASANKPRQCSHCET
jgi:hypothetical protein